MLLDRAGLDDLISVLQSDGYSVVGPTVRDSAIVLDVLDSGADLSDGWGVDTAPGVYRLRARTDGAVFSHSSGPQSWKQFLHPAKRALWSSDGDTFTAAPDEPPRYAFLGVRGCDLAAIATLGGVLGHGQHPDGGYVRRTRDLFVVAVGCTEPGGLCFCASMGTGPAPGPGYDLALTERIDDRGHRFVVEVGTEQGAAVLSRLSGAEATQADFDEARAAVAEAAHHMGRTMPVSAEFDIRTLLRDAVESPRWNDVAERCLTCGNCTMVCPTCFCTTTEDVNDLATGETERTQRWASCFELDFTYLHGGAVRVSGESRYRHWITHKLSTWHDQFGTSGCVGCGRCIAWCPVGIDITEEVHALAAERAAGEDDDDH